MTLHLPGRDAAAAPGAPALSGKFAYLSPGQTAADTFSHTVTDGTRVSSAANVTVILTGVLPTAGPAGPAEVGSPHAAW